MDNFNNDENHLDEASRPQKSRIDALTDLSVSDLKDFFTKPYVIGRLFCLLCSLVVTCSISGQGWEAGFCKFNYISSTCNFASFLGTFSILLVLFFILVDTHFDKLPNILTKKYVLIADLVTSGFISFLWFASFCDMADKWRRTNVSIENLGGGHHTVQAAIAFAFFSINAFALSAFLAMRRYQEARTQQNHADPNRTYNTPDPFAIPDEQFTPQGGDAEGSFRGGGLDVLGKEGGGGVMVLRGLCSQIA